MIIVIKKRILLQLVILLYFLALPAQEQLPLSGISFFNPRAQGAHYERQLMGTYPYLYENNNTFQTIVSLSPMYSQSVRPERIAETLFGKDTLSISGSMVSNRENHDFLADFFGLSPTFFSTIFFEPMIQTALLDFDIVFNCNNIAKGVYFKLHAPFCFTKWNFQFYETIFNKGQETPYPAGYQSEGVNPLSAPALSFKKAIQGNLPFGAINPGIEKGIIKGSHSKTGFADITMRLGYNFWLYDTWHIGTYLTITPPTGSQPHSIFLFEPILGNTRHLEMGVGLDAHIRLWEKFEQDLDFYFDLSLNHLFKSKQKRSFDFTLNGFDSRYLLLKEFDNNGNFTGIVTPAINITTLNCKVSNDIEANIIFMFAYRYGNFNFEIGYNGWIRSKEKIEIEEQIPSNTFGIKGIQNVFDLNTNSLDNHTEHTATIAGAPLNQQSFLADTQPIFISTKDLNPHSAASPLLITHTFFSYLGNSWIKKIKTKSFHPFVGVGFEIEFEGINERNSYQIFRTTMSQCTAIIKGGINF